MGFADLFVGVPRYIERHLDAVAPLLVKKAADTLRILGDTACIALGAMVDNCSERQSLQALVSCTAKSQNNDVRNKCGRHLARLLSRMPASRLSQQLLVSTIIPAIGRQLGEGSEEPRTAAKHMLLHVRIVCGSRVNAAHALCVS